MLPSPAPGFDQPLALLRACHDRIRHQCDTLEKLVAHLRTHGLDHDVRHAAAEVLRYFTTAGQHHHEDEEQDLFPLLRGSSPLASLISALEADHRRMEILWSQLQPRLAAPDAIQDIEALATLVQEFNALYAAHIERENRELLPRAEQLLTEPLLAVIGERMARRRGVTP
jgi:hemerythrin-like domain-containing protein